MDTAFSIATDAVFEDPNIGVDATYTPFGGGPITVRAILKSPDQAFAGLGAGTQAPSRLVDLRSAEVADPQEGDTVAISGMVYTVANRTRDVLGLVWSLEVE